jgi:hypothetical protein
VTQSDLLVTQSDADVPQSELDETQIDFLVSQTILFATQSCLNVPQSEVSAPQSERRVSQSGRSLPQIGLDGGLDVAKETRMTLNVSVGELLETLEKKIAFHREQAELHAREEELHRGQRALHEAELESMTRHFEALKAAAIPAAEVVLSVADLDPASPGPEEDLGEDVGASPRLSALVARVLEGRPEGEPFGPTAIAEEINRRFRDRLDQDADVRNVSAALRRMYRKRQIELVREGRSYREALYRRAKRGG